jgi:hypothetical protein
LAWEATPNGAACHPADVNAKERFFSISLFHSDSNSIIYPGKPDRTNPYSGNAENYKRLKNNRICHARGRGDRQGAPRPPLDCHDHPRGHPKHRGHSGRDLRSLIFGRANSEHRQHNAQVVTLVSRIPAGSILDRTKQLSYFFLICAKQALKSQH